MPEIETNGVETYYERRGSGPQVVFVHGAILDHSQWDPQVEALAEDYEVITYDVRGHGRTGGSPVGTYSVGLFAADLRALVDALDLDRPVVCGLSMGGCIAQVYAAAHPGEISGLVLADTFAPELGGRGEWVQRSLLLRATVPFVRLVGYERVERALVWLQRRLHGARVGGDYERVEALRASGPKLTTAEFAKVVRAVAAFHETTVDLAAIAAPTLVLYGEHEPPFVRRHAATFAAGIPNVEVREVPDAGHASNLDNPEFFTAELGAFLDGVRA
ncbi:alpha/beta fold hydrolase [Halobacterium sp. R2-5]|uniref:alpha/beta fold hydrolase n=1 Tax=Halobacterium sp. R2-5 TaxID=2715751 RepID=UPI001423FC99|nr:alpha/beta fold hydrolase [Halobacterium sp. R2-5]NIC00466.1 alpha/beta fold hydrolase [Halobacterium sp. R2-5]